MKVLAVKITNEKMSHRYYNVEKETSMYVKLKPTSVEDLLQANNGSLTIPVNRLGQFIPNGSKQFGYTVYVINESDTPNYLLLNQWSKDLKHYALEQLREKNRQLKELFNTVQRIRR